MHCCTASSGIAQCGIRAFLLRQAKRQWRAIVVDITSDRIARSQPRWSVVEFARYLRPFAARLEKRRVYKQTLQELQSYSRRNLLDMGIDPDGIEDLARRAAGL